MKNPSGLSTFSAANIAADVYRGDLTSKRICSIARIDCDDT
jgi:hypothetical protein